MLVNQRVKELIKYSKLSASKFADEIGFNYGTLNNVIGGRKSIPSHTLLKAILKRFPEINPYWLILGEGEMVLEMDYKSKSTIEKRLVELEDFKSKSEKDSAQIKLVINKIIGVLNDSELIHDSLIDMIQKEVGE